MLWSLVSILSVGEAITCPTRALRAPTARLHTLGNYLLTCIVCRVSLLALYDDYKYAQFTVDCKAIFDFHP